MLIWLHQWIEWFNQFNSVSSHHVGQWSLKVSNQHCTQNGSSDACTFAYLDQYIQPLKVSNQHCTQNRSCHTWMYCKTENKMNRYKEIHYSHWHNNMYLCFHKMASRSAPVTGTFPPFGGSLPFGALPPAADALANPDQPRKPKL
jgi:hypothetical protein